MTKKKDKINIVIHLGMPKTATTFLQWNVFHYLDVNYLWHIFHKNWIKNIIFYDKELDLDHAKSKIEQCLKPDQINLFSEENLYTDYLVKKDDRFILLDRIKYIFPEAKIIFGIRDKKTLLVSWYKQYVATGGTKDYNYFLENIMNKKKLDYKEYLKKLEKYYGKNNIFIYRLEEIQKNQEKVVKNMCRFIGVPFPDDYRRKPTNVGYSLETLKISLIINKIFKTRLNPEGIIPFPNYALPQRIFFQSNIMRKILPQTKITEENLKKIKTRKLIK